MRYQSEMLYKSLKTIFGEIMKLYTDFTEQELATVETVINKVATNEFIENDELKVFNA